MLYQAGAATEVYCIDTQTGDILWKEDGGLRSVILAEPRLVEQTGEVPKLFVIEGMKGKVRQHDALTGDINWTFDCRDVSGVSCNDAVEADYSVSSTGNMLYYGDIFGKIVALEIAQFETVPPAKEETAPPTAVAPVVEEVVDSTESPTWAPGDLVVVPEVEENATPPGDTDFESETGSGTVAVPSDSSTTELGASAAANSEAGEPESFFSNDIMIILVAVCGGLALAIIAVLFAKKIRSRSGKPAEKTKNEKCVLDKGDQKGWTNAQDEYEDECRRDEEETLREIVNTPTTPNQSGSTTRTPKKQKQKLSPATPATLASIEESPAECETSFAGSNPSPTGTPPRKNLETAFEESLLDKMEEKKEESLLEKSAATRGAQEYSAAVPDDETGADVSMCSKNSVPHDLESVEVVANGGSSVISMPSIRSAKSPNTVPGYQDTCANDLMSVDGSLYLDDDSLFQGRAEVASLSQYSVASTTDGGSQLAGTDAVEEGEMRFVSANSGAPGSHYLQPPRVASPSLTSGLSPEVKEYLRQNQSISPTPMTPGYIPSQTTSPQSNASPISPLSDAGKSPSESVGRELARAGSSVRKGGSFGHRQSRGQESSSPVAEASSSSRTASPPPQPPMETEDEPEDAWNSFLSELAKAERQFFNPTFSGKKKKKQERAQSPPPPPPPYSPPGSPIQAPPPPPPPPPPTRNSSGRRRL